MYWKLQWDHIFLLITVIHCACQPEETLKTFLFLQWWQAGKKTEKEKGKEKWPTGMERESDGKCSVSIQHFSSHFWVIKPYILYTRGFTFTRTFIYWWQGATCSSVALTIHTYSDTHIHRQLGSQCLALWHVKCRVWDRTRYLPITGWPLHHLSTNHSIERKNDDDEYNSHFCHQE